MSWRPNYSFGGAPYGGGGNYDERYDNNGEDYYHSSRSRRSSEDDYRRSRSRCDDDHYDRRRRSSSRDNYHRRRRSSSSSNDFSMELSTTNIDGQLPPGSRYVERHHLDLTSSGDFSYDYYEYATPWEEDGWGQSSLVQNAFETKILTYLFLITKFSFPRRITLFISSALDPEWKAKESKPNSQRTTALH